MARIDDCTIGARVKFTDGWGGPGSVVGRRMNNQVEGSLVSFRPEGDVERRFPDLVLVRFETPVCDGVHRKVVAINAQPNDLTLL